MTLQKLAAEGAIDADHPVPCKIESADDALESSLVENTIRAAMHPADEFVAMAELIDGGMTIDAVAKRFGTSERHVRQRLRLGKLAPELIGAYRAGQISLDIVTAFYPRRRSRGAARGVEPSQTAILHPALHGEASPHRKRRPA